MEPYPRRLTWPYLLSVFALFLVAVASPRWWRSLDDQTRQNLKAKLTLYADTEDIEVASAPPAVAMPGRIHIDFNPDWLRPQIASMNPIVAQRVTIDPLRDQATPFTVEDLAGQEKADVIRRSDASKQNRLLSTVKTPAPLAGALDFTGFELDDVSSSLPSGNQRSEPSMSVELPSEWPEPTSLLARLEEVCIDVPLVEAWRSAAIESLWRLQATDQLASVEVVLILDELEKLAEVLPHVEKTVPESDRVLLRQIAYGIERRVAVWRAVHRLAKTSLPVPTVNLSDMQPVLQQAEKKLEVGEEAAGWRAYLELDKLNQIAMSTWVTDPAVREATSRLVLKRLANPRMSDRQREFLNSEPFVEFADQLRIWAQVAQDYPQVTRTIEQFESSRSARLGERVIEAMDDLRWADTSEADQLKKVLDTHYRNANVRIAVTGQLLNDLLPVLEPIRESVNDTVLGASVRGSNNTWTQLRVKLIEDDQQLRLRFVASGRTRSRTLSQKGPVRFFSRSSANFAAGQELMVSRRGISRKRATATANGKTRITKLKTDYDEVPLIGWLMRQLAIDELRENRAQMQSAVRSSVSTAARERLDETLETKVSGAELKWKQRVLEPLDKLKLDPSAIEMRTTEERMVMRCRLAAESQLAAYTPRPRALRGSVLSFQFHESAANNLLEQLDLDGQRIELEDLMKRMSEKLDIRRSDIHEDIPEGVKLRLGEDRPIQIDLDDGRVLITIRLAELSTPRRKWRNFVVRGRYRADVVSMHVNLEREGGIELISEQLGFRDQIALRGIFTKVMARNHRLNLIHGRLATDPRLKKLSVTQFVVRDGWVGVSVGPQKSTDQPQEANVASRLVK